MIVVSCKIICGPFVVPLWIFLISLVAVCGMFNVLWLFEFLIVVLCKFVCGLFDVPLWSFANSVGVRWLMEILVGW